MAFPGVAGEMLLLVVAMVAAATNQRYFAEMVDAMFLLFSTNICARWPPRGTGTAVPGSFSPGRCTPTFPPEDAAGRRDSARLANPPL